jgi:membrane protease YdiL (CAAX protease family)
MSLQSASISSATSGIPSSPREPAWRVFARAIGAGVSVFLVAQGVWFVLLGRLLAHPSPAPWELPAMAAFMVGGIVLLKRGARTRTGVRFNAVPVRTVLLALAAGWSTILAGFLAYVAHRAAAGMGGEIPLALPHAGGLLATLVMSAIVAGTVEEIAFRGFMQGSLEKRFGLVPAIVVSGLAWALFHTNHSYFGEEAFVWLGIFLAVATGLGIIASRTDSVVPGILVHAGFDMAYFVAAGILEPKIAPIAWVETLARPSSLLALAAVLAVCALPAWLAFLRATRT